MIRVITFCLFSALMLSCKNDKKAIGLSQEKVVDIITETVNAHLSHGTLNRIEKFPSKYVQPRHVDVWLPDNYSETKKYAVLYMHDGQMLFDSTSTWNHQEWKIDEIASRLMKEQKVKNFIVVGIWNISEIRWQDYFPEKAFSYLSEKDKDSIKKSGNDKFKVAFHADNYLKFLVEELKPFVDSHYATIADEQNTFVAGSSMGGLISMYAISEYPKVFGGAACISTHWPGIMPKDDNPVPQAIFDYMRANLPSPKNHKFYFDYGTQTLDAYYPQYADEVDSIFKEKGYTQENFRNLKFEGQDHSENSWNKRLDVPFTFLLSKE
ncbi:alpha/beta hydrolase [Mangrovimonas aestuarii]|uniref:alpha/beta hydrolase n=1 Tax=Mangrovimonas aestuarii TaxID=3018443 RepID=UPI002379EB15|nr:alpha/beta hydrolase-fold protein [Mangrovimonas aestuarii]